MRPARIVVPRAPHREVGVIHATWFQEREIHHESRLERSFIEVALLMPGLRGIRHQPLTINYEVGRPKQTYTPDFELTFDGGESLMVEVKPQRFLEKHRQKLMACADILAQRGQLLYVCTDARLRRDLRRRASELRDSARRVAPEHDLVQLLRLVRENGRIKIASAIAAGVDLAVIAHAVGRRYLTVGSELDLSPMNWLRSLESESEFVRRSDWLGGPPWGADVGA